MAATTAPEKLRVLLPHWIEHNRDHGAEFRKWAALAEQEGAVAAAGHIRAAAELMDSANEQLRKAVAAAGGTEAEHHHHSH